jgi:RHS repeat-associated protein
LTSVEYQRGPDLGGGIGGLLYSLRGNSPRFNLSNARGDIVAQSNLEGAVTWTASYEAFGQRPVETGVNADRQRANSKDEDPTRLLNEGFRYRDLETGVWLSRDPAGFVDGPNLYAYVTQNPWTKFDPQGLCDMDEFQKDSDQFFGDMGKMWDGYGEALDDTGKGLKNALEHPLDTLDNLRNALLHPIDSAKAAANAISDAWNSGTEGKGKVIGSALITAATAVAPFAEAGEATSLAGNLERLGEAANTADKAGETASLSGSALKTASSTERALAESTAAKSVSKLDGMPLTGVAKYDQLAVDSKYFDDFINGVKSRGFRVSPDPNLAERANLRLGQNKVVFEYNPKSFNVLDMRHEIQHFNQFKQLGRSMFDDIPAMERGAYGFEMNLGRKAGFSSDYMDWLWKRYTSFGGR